MNKYIVVNASEGPSRNPYVHKSLAAAQLEAGRLASRTPDTKFYVLQAVGFMLHKRGQWQSEFGFVDKRNETKHDAMENSTNPMPRFESDDGIPF